MSQTILLRRSNVAGKVPTTSQLELGELSNNTYDGKYFFKRSSDDSIQSIVTTNSLTSGSITLSGSLTVTGSQYISDGSLDVGGSITLTNNMGVGGDLSVTGSTYINGNMTAVSGTFDYISASGDFVVDDIISDTGSFGYLSVNGDLVVDDITSDTGSFGYLDVSGDLVVDDITSDTGSFGYLDVSGDISVTSTASFGYYSGQSSIVTLGTVTSGDVKAILPSGTVSASAQLEPVFLEIVGDSVVSSSVQIDHDQTTNYVAGEHYLQSQIVEVGAVNSGSITSGFGNIDIGSSTFDTTGAVTLGATTIVGNAEVTGSVVSSLGYANHFEPTSTAAYDLGNVRRWRSLNLSSNIYIGGSSLVDSGKNITATIISASNDIVTNGDILISTNNNGLIGRATGNGQIDLIKINASNNVVVGSSATGTVINGSLITFVGDQAISGSVTISGSLVVLGETIEAQVTELTIEDKLITVASGSVNGAASDGAGLEIDRGSDTNVALTWDNPNDRFDFNKGLAVSGSLTVSESLDAGNTTVNRLIVDTDSVVTTAAGVFRSGGGTFINSPAGTNAYLGTGGSAKLTWNADGVDVTGVLDVSSDISGSAILIDGQATVDDLLINAPAYISPSSAGVGQFSIATPGYTGYITLDGTAMYVGHNATSTDLVFQTNETDRLSISNLGAVSIVSTLAVGSGLTVTGSILSTATGHRLGNLGITTTDPGVANTGKGIWADSAGSGVLGLVSSTGIQLDTGGSATTAVIIGSDQNVSVEAGDLSVTGSLAVRNGTASGGLTRSETVLSIDGGASDSTGVSVLSSTTGVGAVYFSDSGNSNAGQVDYNHTLDRLRLVGTNTVSLWTGGSERLSINSSGNTQVTGSMYLSNSGDNVIVSLDAAADAQLVLDRGSTSRRAYIPFRTAGIDNFYIGMADSDEFGDGTDFYMGANRSAPSFVIDSSGLTQITGSLETTGNITANSATGILYLGNDSDQYITGNASSNYLTISTANQERIRINSSGNTIFSGSIYVSASNTLAMGTNDVENWATSEPAIEFTRAAIAGGNAGLKLYANAYNDGLYKYKVNNSATLAEIHPSTGFSIFTTPLGTADTQITWSTRFAVSTPGSASFGTSTPHDDYRVAIDGGLYVSSSTGGASVFKVEGTSGSLFEVVDSFDGVLMTVNDSSAVPIFIVSSSGAVGINKPNAVYELDVNGTGSFTGDLYVSGNLSVIGDITLDDVSSDTGSFGQVHATDWIGVGTTNTTSHGQEQLHVYRSAGDGNPIVTIQAGDGGASYLQIANAGTNSTNSDGFFIGIESDESAMLYNRENTNMRFWTNGSERMRIVSSSGALLVGTTDNTSHGNERMRVVSTSTDPQLNVHSTAATSQIQITTDSTGTANSNGFGVGTTTGYHFLWGRGTVDIAFATNSTERMRIASGSYGVSMGTTSTWPWTGYASIDFQETAVVGQTSVGGDLVGFVSNAYYDGSWRAKTTGESARYSVNADASGNVFLWEYASSGTAGALINGGSGTWDDIMRLTSAGTLLINTGSASGHAQEKLAVATSGGNIAALIYAADSDQSVIQFANTATGTATGAGFHFGIDASENVVLRSKLSSDIIFYTANSEKMRYDHSESKFLVTGSLNATGDISATTFTGDGSGLTNVTASVGVAEPAGSNTEVQYNNSGTTAGATNLIYDTSNGYVGIGGVSSPTAELTVSGSTDLSGSLTVVRSSNNFPASFVRDGDPRSLFTYSDASGVAIVGNSSETLTGSQNIYLWTGGIIYDVPTGDNHRLRVNSVDVMKADSAGVQITGSLDVQGQLESQDATPLVYLNPDSGTPWQLRVNSSKIEMRNASSGDVPFALDQSSLTLIDADDGGAVDSNFIKLARRAGTGDGAFIGTKHDGSDGVTDLFFGIAGDKALRVKSGAVEVTGSLAGSGNAAFGGSVESTVRLKAQSADDTTSLGIGVRNASGTMLFSVTGAGSGSMNGDLDITGDLTATTKSFLINNPETGGKLRYGNVEAPEHSVMVRGRIKEDVIEMPQEWKSWLIHEDSITVQLTPIGNWAKGSPVLHWVRDIKDGKVFIDSETGKIDCFYLIHATRADVPKLQIHQD